MSFDSIVILCIAENESVHSEEYASHEFYINTTYTTPAHDKARVCSPNNTSIGYQQLNHRFLRLYTIVLHEAKFYLM